jgi:hypothetical protein
MVCRGRETGSVWWGDASAVLVFRALRARQILSTRIAVAALAVTAPELKFIAASTP